jgi:hypothetical protein
MQQADGEQLLTTITDITVTTETTVIDGITVVTVTTETIVTTCVSEIEANWQLNW